MPASRRRFRSALAPLVLTVALAVGVPLAVGCGTAARVDSGTTGTTGPPVTGPVVTGTPGSPPPSASVDGRTFVGRAVTEHGASRPLVAGTKITLGFEDGRLSANAGCNSMSTTYSMEGDQVRVGTDMMTTEMACFGDGRMGQEQWFASLLRDHPTLVLAGDQLVVTSADTVVVLVDRKVAEPDRPLTGTRWVADAVYAGTGPDAAVSSIPAGVTAPALELAPDGTLRFATGCSTGTGRYMVAAEQVTFTAVALDPTPGPCPQAGSHELDAQVVAVLDGTVTMTIDGPTLRLLKTDRGLGFRAG